MPAPTEVKEGQCESCHIFDDGLEEHYILEYKEHKICSWCQANWRRREKLAGREISWEEFVKGKLEKVK